MSMVRNSFSDRREGYTDKAVVIRFFFFIFYLNQVCALSSSCSQFFCCFLSCYFAFLTQYKTYHWQNERGLMLMIQGYMKEKMHIHGSSCYNTIWFLTCSWCKILLVFILFSLSFMHIYFFNIRECLDQLTHIWLISRDNPHDPTIFECQGNLYEINS